MTSPMSLVSRLSLLCLHFIGIQLTCPQFQSRGFQSQVWVGLVLAYALQPTPTQSTHSNPLNPLQPTQPSPSHSTHSNPINPLNPLGLVNPSTCSSVRNLMQFIHNLSLTLPHSSGKKIKTNPWAIHRLSKSSQKNISWAPVSIYGWLRARNIISQGQVRANWLH